MVVACKEGRFNCLTVTQMKWSTKKSHQSHQFNATSRFLPSHMCSSCCLVGGLGRRCDIAISRLVLSGHLCWLRRNRYASIQHVIHVIFCEVLIHSIGVHHPVSMPTKAGSFWSLTEEGLLRGLGFSYVLIHVSPESSPLQKNWCGAQPWNNNAVWKTCHLMSFTVLWMVLM